MEDEARPGNLDLILQVIHKGRFGSQRQHSGDWVENRFEGGKTGSQETSLGNYSNKMLEMVEWMI